jgi:transcriptional regulator with XRE-family HTH domain
VSTYSGSNDTGAIDRRIGQKVRTRRMEVGFSQEALAESLGVTFQQVQKYEKGVNRISASRLFEMAAALGVPVSYFFDGLSLGRRGGVSEDTADFVAATLATPEGLQLVGLFHSIQSAKVRRRVVELVRALAEDSAEDDAFASRPRNGTEKG